MMRDFPRTRFPAILLMALAWPATAPAQYPNVRVSTSSPTDTAANEVTIAINPVNPLNLAAGANVRNTYFSADGGLTWTRGLLPVGVLGDPSVIFDGQGTLYYGHLTDYRRLNVPGAIFIDRLAVHRSTNGGQSWKDSAIVGYNPPRQQDKEWLAADMTNSPFKNNVYMSWTEFDRYGSFALTDSSRILFARSTDGGTSWSTPVRISDQAGNCLDGDSTVEGAVPAVGPNGEVYVSWAGPAGLVIDKSTDGGQTWGKDIFVAAQPGGWDYSTSGIFRANGLPITACDASTSPYRGNVYVSWSDQRNGATNADVFLSRSSDGGATWIAAKRVNSDLTFRDQFFNWMTVDPLTGAVYVVYYDRRNTFGDATEVYVSRSTDGGESFTDFKVSQSPFLPKSTVFIGDYTNIAARGGNVYPIWTRLDTTKLSIWTALMKFIPDAVEQGEDRLPGGFGLGQNYPNPFNPATTIPYSLPAGCDVRLEIFDLLGRRVATLLDGPQEAGRHVVSWDANAKAAGVYFCRMTTARFTSTRTLVLIR